MDTGTPTWEGGQGLRKPLHSRVCAHSQQVCAHALCPLQGGHQASLWSDLAFSPELFLCVFSHHEEEGEGEAADLLRVPITKIIVTDVKHTSCTENSMNHWNLTTQRLGLGPPQGTKPHPPCPEFEGRSSSHYRMRWCT